MLNLVFGLITLTGVATVIATSNATKIETFSVSKPAEEVTKIQNEHNNFLLAEKEFNFLHNFYLFLKSDSTQKFFTQTNNSTNADDNSVQKQIINILAHLARLYVLKYAVDNKDIGQFIKDQNSFVTGVDLTKVDLTDQELKSVKNLSNVDGIKTILTTYSTQKDFLNKVSVPILSSMEAYLAWLQNPENKLLFNKTFHARIMQNLQSMAFQKAWAETKMAITATKADQLLPDHLSKALQQFVDGAINNHYIFNVVPQFHPADATMVQMTREVADDTGIIIGAAVISFGVISWAIYLAIHFRRKKRNHQDLY